MNKHKVVSMPLPGGEQDGLTDLLRKGAQSLISQAVEAELAELLALHAGRRDDLGRRAVVRNGYLPEREVVTGIGPVSVKVPKVRTREGEPVVFRSSLVPPYVRRSRSMDAALPWLYLQGISTGKMKAALSVLVGPEASGLSPAVVSRLKAKWADEYEAWRRRDFTGERFVYWWADGIYSGLRAEDQKLCALVIIGVNEHGQKRFLAIEDGIRESAQSWREVLLDLKARGLTQAPWVAVGDGALGFWAALDEIYPQARHQRCWVHKTANVQNYLPKALQPKAKAALHEIWMAPSRARAHSAFDQFMATYGPKYPKATHCLEKDRDALLAFYDFPAEHWTHLRTTNPIESSFATIRHRSKQAKGCLSRSTMLSMIFKLGMSAEDNWRRLRGFKKLGQVIDGVKFRDGVEAEQQVQRNAA